MYGSFNLGLNLMLIRINLERNLKYVLNDFLNSSGLEAWSSGSSIIVLSSIGIG